MEEFKYDIFLSYRHRKLDSEITQKTFNAVESYRLPESLKKKGYKDIRRAFRDTEELSVSKILTSTIDDALASTNCMILICSTDAPLSPWVDREVSNFIELGRADHIYPLLISGDPETSFPPSLKLVPDIMDRLMDIRVPGNDTKAMMAKAETELLKVIAGVTGCDLAELQREHALRKNRRFMTRAASAAAAFLLIGGVSLGLMRLAQNYRDTAQKKQETSMLILQQLTYDLPDKLTNVSGAYERISGILTENTEEINEILLLSPDSQEAKAEVAANTTRLATAMYTLGEYHEAFDRQTDALEQYEALASEGYEKAGEEIVSARSNLGKIRQGSGNYADAATEFEKAIAAAEQLENCDEVVLARLYFNAGSNYTDAGQSDRAQEKYESALNTLEPAEESADMLALRAQIRYEYGLILYRSRKFAEAEKQLNGCCEDYDKLLDNGQNSLQNLNSTALAFSATAACYTDDGKYDKAEGYYTRAKEAAEELTSSSDDVSTLQTLAQICSNYGLFCNTQERYSEADELYTRAAEIYGEIFEKSQVESDGAVYGLALLNAGENAFKMGDMDSSNQRFLQGITALNDAQASMRSDYYTAQFKAWLSYYQLIHMHEYEAALASALEAYDLQSDNVLVNLNLAYACLYTDHWEDYQILYQQLAALGEAQIQTIKLDLDAQRASGMTCTYMADAYALMGIDITPEETLTDNGENS